jgi:hypothetical protein
MKTMLIRPVKQPGGIFARKSSPNVHFADKQKTG